ncbi:hypothetical protein AB6D87_16015 [Vibrio lentus]
MKVCILCHSLRRYAGSERVIYEISREILRQGHSLIIGCIDPGEFYFNEMEGIYLTDKPEDMDGYYDVIINFHWSSYGYFFPNSIKYKRLVLFSLSPFEPNEYPNLYLNPNALAFNSLETKKSFMTSVGCNWDESSIASTIFPNSLNMDENKKTAKYLKNKDKLLSKVAIVSNHISEEVKGAVLLLNQVGIDVEVFGFDDKVNFIDSNTLEGYDLVITIGYTVVIAMANEIPVYVYDCHGGKGYLSEDLNVDSEFNFSGRPYGKKSSDELFLDILLNYGSSVSLLKHLRRHVEEYNDISKNLDKILGNINDELNNAITDCSMAKISMSYAINLRTFRHYENYYFDNFLGNNQVEKKEKVVMTELFDSHRKKIAVFIDEEHLSDIVDEFNIDSDLFIYLVEEKTNLSCNQLNLVDFFNDSDTVWDDLITDSKQVLFCTKHLNIKTRTIYIEDATVALSCYLGKTKYIVRHVCDYVKLKMMGLNTKLLSFKKSHNSEPNLDLSKNTEVNNFLILTKKPEDIIRVFSEDFENHGSEVWLGILSERKCIESYFVDMVLFNPNTLMLTSVISESDEIVLDSDDKEMIEFVISNMKKTTKLWVRHENDYLMHKLNYINLKRNAFDKVAFSSNNNFLLLEKPSVIF